MIEPDRAKLSACGRAECGVSMFIDEETLTFGTGKHYSDGSWEFPCGPCFDRYLKQIADARKGARKERT